MSGEHEQEQPPSFTATILPGTRLGPYEIVGELGAGGMGKVYRARDSRLGRAVAIKISADQFSSRFEREARAIAALNHPHICTLYDVGPNYLVMELVEGDTLKGPVSAEQAVRYGSQIADALAAAHSQGIIHRDLKPRNIMVTKSGIKVLDFGLAKFRDSDENETLTGSHMILGTPAYMAPEQREGKPCDQRTDIYALGLVLKELQPTASPALAHVVDRCLAANPGQRWQAASDVKLELEWAAGRQLADTLAPAPARPKPWWATVIAVIAALLAGIAGSFAWFRPQASETPVYRLSLAPPPDTEFVSAPNRSGIALSPDGHTLVFLAIGDGKTRLWVQPLDSTAARELAGTDDASIPFWSADGRSIGFFAAGSLKRIDADGSNLQVLCDIRAARGATWSPDGFILFAPSNSLGGAIYRIAATGGNPVPVTMVDVAHGERYHARPRLFGDGSRFLYHVLGSEPGVYAGSLQDPKFKKRVMAGGPAQNVGKAGADDYLMWNRAGTLVAQKWSTSSLQLLGHPVPLATVVSASPEETSPSSTGTLVYGPPVGLQMHWVDRSGRLLGALGEGGAQGVLTTPRLSPDGTKIVVASGAAILVTDVTRNVTSRVAGPGGGSNLSWSPDGSKIAFTAGREIELIYADGSNPKMLAHSEGVQPERIVGDWTPDGRSILYLQVSGSGRSSLWITRLDSAEQPRLLLDESFDVRQAAISPDGEWLAYSSGRNERYEVYLQKLNALAHANRTQVSSGGGEYPRWRGDGRELYYLGRDSALRSVTVHQGAGELELEAPRILFPLPSAYIGSYSYDVARDGNRFLVLAPLRRRAHEPLTVIVNWPAALKK